MKRVLSVILTVLLISPYYFPARAVGKPKRDEPFAERVKAGVNRLGTGPEARVEVTLRDQSKLKGYISQVSDNDFTVIAEKSGAVIKIPYSQVKAIKGGNLATNAKVALSSGESAVKPLLLAVGVVGGIIIAVALLLKGS